MHGNIPETLEKLNHKRLIGLWHTYLQNSFISFTILHLYIFTAKSTVFFDLFGALCSLLSTYYFVQQDPKAWIIGTVATISNGYLYWHKGIYADTLLEFCYFLTMLYGWYLWQNKAATSPAQTKEMMTLKYRTALILMGVSGIIFGLIYYTLVIFLHSNVAILDASTTTLSLLAQWLMCHKNIITWVLWFMTDLIYALMYFYKQLPAHGFLMIFYTVLAIYGYYSWKKPHE